MPMIIADEIEADWAKCRVEQALGDEPKYGSQNTDGSTSIRDFLVKYREAGRACAPRSRTLPPRSGGERGGEVQAKNGVVVHSASAQAPLAPWSRLRVPSRCPPRSASGSRSRPSAGGRGKKMPSIDLVPDDGGRRCTAPM
ncbi:MAG: hypothetical protein IPK33_25740 [Gemmatimonadetes bacterium]|nr:hypothetical protein [Gemmatimonadota bacterium]